MEPRTKCVKKYLIEEYSRLVTYTLWGMFACILMAGIIVVCFAMAYLYVLFAPSLWRIVDIGNVPYSVYVGMMIVLLHLFTITIAERDRDYLMRGVRKYGGTIVKEKVSALEICMFAVVTGMLVTMINMLLSYNAWILPTFGIYCLCILVFTPPCCAYAWCKGDPESPTDSQQQPPEPETENSQAEQENPAAVNPTPQGNDSDRLTAIAVREWEGDVGK